MILSRNIRRFSTLAGILLLVLSSGCRMVRETEAILPPDEQETEGERISEGLGSSDEAVETGQFEDAISGEPGRVRFMYNKLDRAKVLRAFLGVSEEEGQALIPEGYPGDNLFVQENMELYYTPYTGIIYYDMTDGAGERYETLTSLSGLTMRGRDEAIRGAFPRDDLSSCSADEAREACREAARLLGYDIDHAFVYAVDMEAITNRIRSNEDLRNNAPSSDTPAVTRAYYYELVGQGKTDEELREIWSKARYGSSGALWDKKHEALLLICEREIAGYPLSSHLGLLELLYVPYYGRIMYAFGGSDLRIIDEEPAGSLVSKEAAVAEVMRYLGLEKADEIEILDISIVYSYRAYESELGKELDGSDSIYHADPCYRISYRLAGDREDDTDMDRLLASGSLARTILINALDGQVSLESGS